MDKRVISYNVAWFNIKSSAFCLLGRFMFRVTLKTPGCHSPYAGLIGSLCKGATRVRCEVESELQIASLNKLRMSIQLQLC